MEVWIFLAACFAVYTFFDSKKRGGPNIGFIIGNAIPVVGVFVIPFYLAQRPLIDSEVRHGGTGWNVCRYFALIWTIAMVLATATGMDRAGKSMENIDSDAGLVGATIGTGIGLGLLFCVWISGSGGALLIGLMLKNSAIVEQAKPAAIARAINTKPITARPVATRVSAPPTNVPSAPQPAPAPTPPQPTKIMISVARAGAVIGTFSEGEFKSKLSAGEFQVSDHYWKSGMASWDQIGNYPG